METTPNPTRARAVAALLCGIWFLLTGWIWGFGACVVISYPFAIAGFCLWKSVGKTDPGSKLNRAAIILLGLGLAVSVGAIFLFK